MSEQGKATILPEIEGYEWVDTSMWATEPPEYTCHLMEREGVGYEHGLVYLMIPADPERAVWLRRVWVRREQRGRGLGSRMLEAVVARFGERNISLLVNAGAGEAGPDQSRLIAWYEHHGFHLTGERDSEGRPYMLRNPGGQP